MDGIAEFKIDNKHIKSIKSYLITATKDYKLCKAMIITNPPNGHGLYRKMNLII